MTQAHFDFRPIRDQYPLAFDAFGVWLFNELGAGWDYTHFVNTQIEFGYDGLLYILDTQFNPRDLWDFFDSVGIHGTVLYDHGDHSWGWVIDERGLELDYKTHGLPTRTTAEHACYTRMFGVLNERLSA